MHVPTRMYPNDFADPTTLHIETTNTVFQAVGRIYAPCYILTKVGMQGHVPLLFKITDEVDSRTDVFHSCLNTHSLRCDSYPLLSCPLASHPSGLVPM